MICHIIAETRESMQMGYRAPVQTAPRLGPMGVVDCGHFSHRGAVAVAGADRSKPLNCRATLGGPTAVVQQREAIARNAPSTSERILPGRTDAASPQGRREADSQRTRTRDRLRQGIFSRALAVRRLKGLSVVLVISVRLLLAKLRCAGSVQVRPETTI